MLARRVVGAQRERLAAAAALPHLSRTVQVPQKRVAQTVVADIELEPDRHERLVCAGHCLDVVLGPVQRPARTACARGGGRGRAREMLWAGPIVEVLGAARDRGVRAPGPGTYGMWCLVLAMRTRRRVAVPRPASRASSSLESSFEPPESSRYVRRPVSARPPLTCLLDSRTGLPNDDRNVSSFTRKGDAGAPP